MKIVIKDCRLSFPYLFVPQVDDKGQASFNASLILPKNHPQIAEFEAAMAQVAKEKWADKAAANYTALKASNKLALHDGDTKANLDGYAGNMFISARNRARPTVLDRNKAPLAQSDGKPYSGCYVNVSLDLWAQDSKDYGKRINATLLAVQFAKDGEAFAGGVPFEDSDFETIEGADDLFA